MRDPQEFRNLSKECRERQKSAMEPDVIDQLRLWAVELADRADEVERCDVASTGERSQLE